MIHDMNKYTKGVRERQAELDAKQVAEGMEPTLTCSEVVERLPAKEFLKLKRDQWTDLTGWRFAGKPTIDDQACQFAEAYADYLHPWRERRVQELEEQVAKLLAENLWMRTLSPDELSYRNGTIAGWQQAHEPARCGHARGNWKDPKYGTPEYAGDERCEVCELLANSEWREQIRKGEKHE